MVDERDFNSYKNIAIEAIAFIRRDCCSPPETSACNFETPFPLIISSFTFFALSRLSSNLSTQELIHFKTLEAQAVIQLEKRITKLLGRVLLLEFRIFVSDELSDLDLEVQRVNSTKSKKWQKTFATWVNVGGGWDILFIRYAALPFLIGGVIINWINGLKEFLARLTKDLDEIANFFSIGKEIYKITVDHSDSHCGARTVHIVEMSDGQQVVYKCKNMGMSVATEKFVRTVEALTKIKSFQCPTTLNKGAYGWQKFISFSPDTSSSYAHEYYRRCGSTLSLLHLINGEDMHYENIICSDGSPYVIDCETIITPRGNCGDIDFTSGDFLWDSVLRTGMLPRWNCSPTGGFDVSALGCAHNMENSDLKPCWIDSAYDSVALIDKPIPVGASKLHRPHADCPQIINFLDDVKQGFTDMYDSLLINSNSIKNAYHFFKDCYTRVLFRTTREYEIILRTATSPSALTTLDKFIATIKNSCNSGSLCDSDQTLDSVILSEVEQLSLLDIPYFSIPTTPSPALFQLGHTKSGYESIVHNLEALNSDDKAAQLKIIEHSIWASAAYTPSQSCSHNSTSKLPHSLIHTTDAQSTLDNETQNIYQAIENGCIHLPGDNCTWLNLDYIESMTRYQLNPMRSSLYAGRIGVAIFLSSIKPKQSLYDQRELLSSIVCPIVESVQNRTLTELRSPGLTSAFFGLPSIAYGLALIADNLHDNSLLDHSLAIIRNIKYTPLSDEPFDFLNGLAGAIRALIAIYERTHENWLLDLACSYADHLVNSRQKTKFGQMSWTSPLSKSFLVGFAHGGSGIAYSLSALSSRINSRKYVDAVLDALRYEDHAIKLSNGKVPDFRIGAIRDTPRSVGFSESWCTGISGVYLSRCAISNETTEPEIAEFLDYCGHLELNTTLSEMDHVCCGNVGKLELLLEQSRSTAAIDFALSIIKKSNSASHITYSNLPSTTPNYSFFKGISGIGYAFQRLIDPSLPSVLLLQ